MCESIREKTVFYFLPSLFFYMVLELGMVRGCGFVLPLHNLHVCFPHLVAFFLICMSLFSNLLDMNPSSPFISPHVSMGLVVREGVKEHDMYVKPKSCKFKLL